MQERLPVFAGIGPLAANRGLQRPLWSLSARTPSDTGARRGSGRQLSAAAR